MSANSSQRECSQCGQWHSAQCQMPVCRHWVGKQQCDSHWQCLFHTCSASGHRLGESSIYLPPPPWPSSASDLLSITDHNCPHHHHHFCFTMVLQVLYPFRKHMEKFVCTVRSGQRSTGMARHFDCCKTWKTLLEISR